jgi:hypothetical protein
MLLRRIIFTVGIILFFSSCKNTESYDDIRARIVFSYDYWINGIGLDAYNVYEPPVRFFDTNPAIPGMPEMWVDYITEPGQYYLEHVTCTNKAYYMIYTIEVWDTGDIMDFPRFHIDLRGDSRGPRWDDPSGYYTGDVEIEPIRGEIPSRSVIPKGSNIGPLLYKITQKKEGASMIIEYGVLNE